jgi:hypothetical protein
MNEYLSTRTQDARTENNENNYPLVMSIQWGPWQWNLTHPNFSGHLPCPGPIGQDNTSRVDIVWSDD